MHRGSASEHDQQPLAAHLNHAEAEKRDDDGEGDCDREEDRQPAHARNLALVRLSIVRRIEQARAPRASAHGVRQDERRDDGRRESRDVEGEFGLGSEQESGLSVRG